MLSIAESTPYSPFPGESPLFGPCSSNINHIEGKGEHPSHGASAVGNGVGFEESRDRLIPLIGFDGDMFLQERSWLGGGEATFGVPIAERCKETIDRSRGNRFKLPLDQGGQVDFIVGEPERDHGFESLAASEITGNPEMFEKDHQCWIGVDGMAASTR